MENKDIGEALAKVIVGNVHLPIERYNELLQAERDAQLLKDLFTQKAKSLFESISASEIEVIAKLFGLYPNEPYVKREDVENG